MGSSLPARQAIPWIASVLLVCVFIQAALGAYGIWGRGGLLAAHTTFVHVFELLPLLLVAAGIAGRDRLAIGLGVVLFVLIGAQYGLIRASSTVRPLHIVNAFVIFGMAMALVHARSRRRASAGGRTEGSTL